MTKASVQSANSGLPVVQRIPTNILQSGNMSTTSIAGECFVNQRFSSKLQAFLISYAAVVSSEHSIYNV